MSWRSTVRIAAARGFLFGCLTAVAVAGDIAAVVRSDVAADNLTFIELRKIFLGDRKFWTSDLRVTLVMRGPGPPEHDVVLKRVYQMSEAQYSQYWIAKVFRHEADAPPKLVHSAEAAAELVTGLRGAIAFVDSASIPKGVKVLKIDGKLPGSADYPLR